MEEVYLIWYTSVEYIETNESIDYFGQYYVSNFMCTNKVSEIFDSIIN